MRQSRCKDGVWVSTLPTVRGLQTWRPEDVVNVRPSILCPIDFSDASAGALRYAAAIAEHFVTRLIVLTVESPLLAAALDTRTRTGWTSEVSEQAIARFVSEIFGERASTRGLCEHQVAMGKPAAEILRVARERSCDLIVMSSHGRTGPRKWLLGSTVERVLRETAIPMLVVPPADPGPIAVEDAARLIERIVVPVDLSQASRCQLRVAQGLAETLGVPVVVVHALEPTAMHVGLNLTQADANRRADAAHALAELIADVPGTGRDDRVIVCGDPAEAIADVVKDRGAGLVVMGLHGGPLLGPRMGSVTYRTLSRSHCLVLALPPQLAASRSMASRHDEALPGVGFEVVAPKRA